MAQGNRPTGLWPAVQPGDGPSLLWTDDDPDYSKGRFRVWTYGAPRVDFQKNVTMALVEQTRTIGRRPVRTVFKFRIDPYWTPLLQRVSVESLKGGTLTASEVRQAVSAGEAEAYLIEIGREINDPVRTPRLGDRAEARKRIVAAYRKALKAGHEKPRVAVELETGYSNQYIANRLSEARKLGELGATTPGRAGELRKPRKRQGRNR